MRSPSPATRRHGRGQERGRLGRARLRHARGPAFLAALEQGGAVPLPPYIRGGVADAQDRADYQTLFARYDGSVAAPTAGLHFTPELMAALAAAGVATAGVTLHVGAGTFQPVRVDDTDAHTMHAEWGEVPEQTARAVEATRAAGGRVVSIGTTALRLLEAWRAIRRPDHGLDWRDRHLHHAGLPLPRRRPAADQLPPAALDAFHAGGGLRRAGAHEGGLCPRHRRAIPLLFLRRLLFVAAMSLSFELLGTDGAARRGRITTAHGTVETPAFMPVGTAGTVKAMLPQSVAETGAEIVLGNTFHLMLRPGAERVAALGGLHKFMNWPGPILTDSGGFQVMSLTELRKLDPDGVTFRSPIDGSQHRLTPERSIEIQQLLDADITMSFDECTSWPVEEAAAAASMRLSMNWAERGKRAFTERPGYGLFGIVQGSIFPALRAESVKALDRHRLRRLRGRRSCGRRGPGGDVRHARRHPAPAAGRPAALSDGRRPAGRHRGRRQARHRHVRLRAADARRPHGAGLHAPRRAQPAQRAPSRRSAADRRALRLPGLPAPQPRLPASSRSAARRFSRPCC